MVSQRDVMVPGLGRLRDRYEAIFLDLDGTTLDGRGELSPRTHAAVRSLVDHGFQVVLCTGRSIAGTQPFHEALELETPMATYNGSWIGYESGSPVHYIPIPDELLEDIFAHEEDARFVFRHHNEWKHTILTDHPEHAQISNWFQKVVHAEEVHHLPSADLMRVSMFFCATDLPNGDIEHTLTQRLAQSTRDRLRIEVFPLALFPPYSDSTLHLFEIQGWSNGKAEALDYLHRTQGIPHERMIAVGDHNNDLTMLEAAGLAVTPQNGIPECQARAHLTIGHHEQEGLAAWIEAGAPLGGWRPRQVEVGPRS